MEILGGTAGWSYDDWVGPFYPEETARGFSRLKFYSAFFDCVEVDSTFYRHFPPGVAEKWLSEVEENREFVFLTKLYKGFTHGDRGKNANFDADRRVVVEFLKPLIERRRLGGMLVQFSEYFKDGSSSRDHVSLILDVFGAVQLFFELRHRSWYTPQAREFLSARGVDVIAVDQPLLNGMVELTPEIVGENGYFRLHGRNEKMWEESHKSLAARRSSPETAGKDDAGRNDRYNYLYSGTELDEIESKIRRVAERCKRIYVVANNHPMGKAVANALDLVKRLRNAERVRVPDTVIRYFPELEEIAERVDVSRSDRLF